MGVSVNRNLLFILLPLAFSLPGKAQVRSVHNATGSAAIVNITPEQAKEKAIAAAKAEALRMAGAQEWIQAFDFLDKREVNKTVDEFFHSVTSVQTMGNVLSWQLTSEEKKLDERGNLSYNVAINAEVKLYETRPDPEFTLIINGLEPVYKNNGSLQFSIVPNQTGYLTVFNIDQNSNVTQIYPNAHETTMRFESGHHYTFPISPYFRYEVYSELKEEINNVFFLFTKVHIPFTGASFESLIEHIYKIEPRDRFLALEKFRIIQ
jgi:hypothetical protein